MDRPKIKCRGEEAIIQEKIIAFLRARNWYVNPTHGNMYQRGFPDLFCCHRLYGIRWIEVKCPVGYGFTPAQLREFPAMQAAGCGVWIMTEASEDQLNRVISGPPNWAMYLACLNQRSAHGCQPTRY